MSQESAWDAAELLAFHAFVSGVVEEMREESESLISDGDELLEGNWEGVSSSKFTPGWEEWKEGDHQVVAALDGEGELVVASAGQYEQAEEGNQVRLTQEPLRVNF